MDNRIGQRLGNYRLVDLVGVGSLTKVYLGEHVHLNTLAAIKVLDVPLASESTSVARFRIEAHVLAKLVHPNIVQVLDFAVEDSTFFLVKTYAPHGTFPQRHPKGSRLSSLIILPYVKQLCSALQYAHNQGVIHRDIKPENMLFGNKNEVLLDHFCSFLVADLAGREEQSVASTLAYRAPEELLGQCTFASDQYMLGVVIYEWLCGRLPFEGGHWEIVQQHLYVTPTPLREMVPAISAAIEGVILRALAKDPQQRFPSVWHFAQAFEHACSPEQATLATSTLLQPGSSSHTPMEVAVPTKGIKLFFSYSRKDEKLRRELAKRLTLMKRNGLITDWYDCNIDAGADWKREMDIHLNGADIILLLVSPDFIDSDYCYDLEMARALERHEVGEATVIPIILRPASWKETPFGKLKALPEGEKAVTIWSNRDEAFLQIAEGIQKVVEKLNEKKPG
jgi:serine/threonine protein kinase